MTPSTHPHTHPLAELLAALGHPALAALVARGLRDLAAAVIVELARDPALAGARAALVIEAVARWGESGPHADLAALLDGVHALDDAHATADALDRATAPAAHVAGATVIRLRRPVR